MQYVTIVTGDDGTNEAWGPTTSNNKAQTWADEWNQEEGVNAYVLPLQRIP